MEVRRSRCQCGGSTSEHRTTFGLRVRWLVIEGLSGVASRRFRLVSGVGPCHVCFSDVAGGGGGGGGPEPAHSKLVSLARPFP